MVSDKIESPKSSSRYVLHLVVNGDERNTHPFSLSAKTPEQAEEEADSIASSFMEAYKKILQDNEEELASYRSNEPNDILLKLRIHEVN